MNHKNNKVRGRKISNIDKAKQELLIRAAKRGVTKLREFMMLKNEISEEFKIDSLPNYGLTEIYDKLVKNKEIKGNEEIKKLLRKAKMRTLSGVAVVAALTKPYACPGNCLYCPSQVDMPKSYLSNEPAVMRAILADFNPYRQMEIRLRALEQAGHTTDKIELIIMGGSFNALPLGYQYWFIKQCFTACNDYQKINQKSKIKNQNFNEKFKSYEKEPEIFNLEKLKKELEKEQKKNEKAKNRIIGLTLETRPDLINEEELKIFREMGCTRIEIGVQTIFDPILKKNKRGHDVAETVRATKLMKDFGFKVSYHMMPGLYGSNLKKDLEMFKVLFSDARFQPDQIKIYPCVVVKDAELYELYKKKKYKAYTDKQLVKLLCEIKKIIPPYVRISRLIRDIPEESIVAGNKITNLRQLIDGRSKKEGWKCKCIRCREIKDKKLGNSEIKKLDIIQYQASGGKEIFLELTDENNHLYALLRLRLPVRAENFLPLQNSAIIREVHTYGQALDVGEIGLDANLAYRQAGQHQGLGRQLIAEAESIAKEAGYKKIAVISGVGAREYYKKLPAHRRGGGYKLEDTYMVKQIK